MDNEVMDLRKNGNNGQALLFDGGLGRYRPVGLAAPLRSSRETSWRGVLLEHHRVSSFDLADGFSQETLVIVHLGAPVTIVVRDADQPEEVQTIPPGTVSVIPSGHLHSARCGENAEFVLVSLDQATMTCAASEFGQSDAVRLRFARGQDDELARAIVLTLKSELESGHPLGEVYAESLGHTLATHLVKSYSAGPVERRSQTGGLPLRLLRRALNFIYANAEREVTLNEIAASVQMSPFHFSRLFKQSVGEPPYRHFLRHRVRRGAERLLTGRVPVARVATELGFVDQSHFTLHFKRFYGMTPSAFVRSQQSRKIIL